MSTDYLDAHERHWLDAELLYSYDRLANADHLYGLASECGLKRLMLVFGMRFDSRHDIPLTRDDRQHIDAIWDRYEAYRSGHHHGVSYILSPDNPFDDWHISQRYAHRSDLTKADVNRHRDGAGHVHRLIQKAQMEGLM